VKIDAEGSEPFVLRGMKRLLRDNPAMRIVMEHGPEHVARAGVSPQVFLRELFSAFTVWRIGDADGELTPLKGPADLDGIWTSNLLLVQRHSQQLS
jgi:hypothetical protein